MKINPNQEGPSFDVAVIVDPLSKGTLVYYLYVHLLTFDFDVANVNQLNGNCVVHLTSVVLQQKLWKRLVARVFLILVNEWLN